MKGYLASGFGGILIGLIIACLHVEMFSARWWLLMVASNTLFQLIRYNPGEP